MCLPLCVPYAAISVQIGDCGEGTIAPHTFSSPINPVPVTPVNVNTQDACMSIVPNAEVATTPVVDISAVCSVVAVPRAEVPTTPVVGAPVVGNTLNTKGVFAVPPIPECCVQ